MASSSMQAASSSNSSSSPHTHASSLATLCLHTLHSLVRSRVSHGLGRSRVEMAGINGSVVESSRRCESRPVRIIWKV